jgi:hypothetical protein
MLRPLVVQGSPLAPQGVTASAGDGTAVTLTWKGPIFPPPLVGYLVQRAADEEFRGELESFEAAAAASSLTDDTVQTGRTYFYRVRAESAAGSSPWSAPAEVRQP